MKNTDFQNDYMINQYANDVDMRMYHSPNETSSSYLLSRNLMESNQSFKQQIIDSDSKLLPDSYRALSSGPFASNLNNNNTQDLTLLSNNPNNSNNPTNNNSNNNNPTNLYNTLLQTQGPMLNLDILQNFSRLYNNPNTNNPNHHHSSQAMISPSPSSTNTNNMAASTPDLLLLQPPPPSLTSTSSMSSVSGIYLPSTPSQGFNGLISINPTGNGVGGVSGAGNGASTSGFTGMMNQRNMIPNSMSIQMMMAMIQQQQQQQQQQQSSNTGVIPGLGMIKPLGIGNNPSSNNVNTGNASGNNPRIEDIFNANMTNMANFYAMMANQNNFFLHGTGASSTSSFTKPTDSFYPQAPLIESKYASLQENRYSTLLQENKYSSLPESSLPISRMSMMTSQQQRPNETFLDYQDARSGYSSKRSPEYNSGRASPRRERNSEQKGYNVGFGESREAMREDLRSGLRDDLRSGPREDLRGGLRDDLRDGPRDDLRGGLREDLRGGPRDDLRGGPRDDLRGGPREDLRGGSREVLREPIPEIRLNNSEILLESHRLDNAQQGLRDNKEMPTVRETRETESSTKNCANYDDIPIRPLRNDNMMNESNEQQQKQQQESSMFSKKKKKVNELTTTVETEENNNSFVDMNNNYMERKHAFDDIPIAGRATQRFEELLEEQLRNDPSGAGVLSPNPKPKKRSTTQKREFLKKGTRQYLSNAQHKLEHKDTSESHDANLSVSLNHSLGPSAQPGLKPASVPLSGAVMNERPKAAYHQQQQQHQQAKPILNTIAMTSGGSEHEQNRPSTSSTKPNAPKKFLTKGRGRGGGIGNAPTSVALTHPNTPNNGANKRKGEVLVDAMALNNAMESMSERKIDKTPRLQEKKGLGGGGGVNENQSGIGGGHKQEGNNHVGGENGGFDVEDGKLSGKKYGKQGKIIEYKFDDNFDRNTSDQSSSLHSARADNKSQLQGSLKPGGDGITTTTTTAATQPRVMEGDNLEMKKENQEIGKEDDEVRKWIEEEKKALKEKMETVNAEIAKAKLESEMMAKTKQKYDELIKIFNKEKIDWLRQREKEIQLIEEYKQEEIRKLIKERKALDRLSKFPSTNRKDRDENELLRKQLAKALEDSRIRDKKNQLLIDRMKKQIDELIHRNEELQQMLRYQDQIRPTQGKSSGLNQANMMFHERRDSSGQSGINPTIHSSSSGKLKAMNKLLTNINSARGIQSAESKKSKPSIRDKHTNATTTTIAAVNNTKDLLNRQNEAKLNEIGLNSHEDEGNDSDNDHYYFENEANSTRNHLKKDNNASAVISSRRSSSSLRNQEIGNALLNQVYGIKDKEKNKRSNSFAFLSHNNTLNEQLNQSQNDLNPYSVSSQKKNTNESLVEDKIPIDQTSRNANTASSSSNTLNTIPNTNPATTTTITTTTTTNPNPNPNQNLNTAATNPNPNPNATTTNPSSNQTAPITTTTTPILHDTTQRSSNIPLTLLNQGPTSSGASGGTPKLTQLDVVRNQRHLQDNSNSNKDLKKALPASSSSATSNLMPTNTAAVAAMPTQAVSMKDDYKYDTHPRYVAYMKAKDQPSKIMTQNITPDGKIQKVYQNGKKEIIFNNGVKREIFPDGYTIVHFANNDIKQTLPDNTIIYYFAEAQTTQTTLVNGQNIYRFSNNQVEFHYTDGSKEIHFSDSTKKIMKATGEEETIFSDGTIQRMNTSKIKTIEYMNKQKDVIYPDGIKIRTFPDGKSKKFYPDGRVEDIP